MNEPITPPRRGQIRSNPRTLQSPRTPETPRLSRAVFDAVVSKAVDDEAESLTPSELNVVLPDSENTQKRLSESASKAMLLSRAVQVKQPIKEKTTVTPRKVIVILLALLLLAVICYIGFDTWRINNNKQVINETGVASNVSSGERQSQEGTDKSPLPKNALTNYTVAADVPRALYIGKIGVAARVLPMALNPDNSIQAPINIFDSGWYTGSAQPGETGAVLVDGHSTTDGRALFGKLGTLVVGDTMELEKGDGTKFTYKVVYKETVDKDAVDMKKLLLPYGNAQRALNLITCSGAWNDAENTLTQRTLIYTVQT